MQSRKLTPALHEKDHHRGALSAPIQLVEYGDFQCGFCGSAFPQIEKFVSELGAKVCFAFRHFPIVNSHPFAMRAAMASEAAHRQGKFWLMHRTLFENQRSFSEHSMQDFALMLGLEMKQFEHDLTSPELVEYIQRDFNSGIASGVNGTPTLYLNGYQFDGNATYRDLMIAAREILPELPGSQADSLSMF